jgi:hypothetical protein
VIYKHILTLIHAYDESFMSRDALLVTAATVRREKFMVASVDVMIADGGEIKLCRCVRRVEVRFGVSNQTGLIIFLTPPHHHFLKVKRITRLSSAN